MEAVTCGGSACISVIVSVRVGACVGVKVEVLGKLELGCRT